MTGKTRKSKLPVDIYVRVSRVGGRENMISPDEQERRARGLAHERKLRIGVVLTDLDESGGKLDRPGLQEALSRVEAGQSGGIIVAWLDRLSRDSEHAHVLCRRIDEAGGVLYAPDAPADMVSPEGELQTALIFAFATYVRKRARAGFERSKEQAIENGIPVHSRAPVGYRPRADRRMELDPEVAPIIRELFERRARGDGPTELAMFLEQEGVRTSQGSKTWAKQAVYGIIRNRTYLGEIAYGLDRRFVNTKAHEPLVDLALWQAAQHPNGRRLTPARSIESSWLLAGVARCAGCGYALQGTTTSRGKRIYRCTGRHAGGLCAQRVRILADVAEQAAVAAFWQATVELEAVVQEEAPDALLSQHEAALVKAESALSQWASPDVQEALADDIATYANGLRERRETRDHAAGLLGRARAENERPASALRQSTARLRKEWDSMGTQERRELLALRFDALAIGRDRRFVVYLAGSAPAGLPTRGYRRDAQLAPFAA